ncbi:hypothetical protein SCHPADRAFT_997132 [Schizopora paradoxa]|uniref:SH3 domain-containing protein n=1 Tax=Schizopora paradoxa TaxID=27342 RepID=A0A0H2RNZ3_9AGAM|nr:hypothetical protein SCHPADRAFT_997132 [Schizopora paradoxa]
MASTWLLTAMETPGRPDSNSNLSNLPVDTTVGVDFDDEERTQIQSDDESFTRVDHDDATLDGSGDATFDGSNQTSVTQSENRTETVAALFDYEANPEDPSELSFKKGITFELIRRVGFWLVVKNAFGVQGIVPSRHFGPTIVDRATALYDYEASPDDPSEISFKKGDTFDIIDNVGKWWSAQTSKGLRIVPSNYLSSDKAEARRFLPARLPIGQEEGNRGSAENKGASIDNPEKPQAKTEGGSNEVIRRARAIYSYTADPNDPHEMSFKKGDILHIIDVGGRWWQVQTAEGVRIAPSNYLQNIDSNSKREGTTCTRRLRESFVFLLEIKGFMELHFRVGSTQVL